MDIIDREKTFKLWMECFPNRKLYNDFYINERFHPNESITIQAQGEVVAALQMLTYNVNYLGVSSKMKYIASICTHKDHRRQGMARNCLIKGLIKIYGTRIPLCCVVPISDSSRMFFRKLGFVNCTYRRLVPYTPKKDFEYHTSTVEIIPVDKISQTDRSRVRTLYYIKWSNPNEAWVLHKKKDMNQTRRAYALLGNTKFLCIREENEIRSFALITETAKENLVQDSYFQSEADMENIYYAYQNLIGDGKKIKYAEFLSESEMNDETLKRGYQPYAMARVACMKEIVKVYLQLHKDEKRDFYVEDNVINGNTGYYSVNKGNVIFRKNVSNPEDYEKIDILVATEKLFDNLNLRMSLMLDNL